MPKTLFPLGVFLSILLATAAGAATHGTVVPIGGHASDIALDEERGVVYVANYTANRIEVISTGTGSIQRSIDVAVQPAALALSPDRRYLVITHVSNFETPFYSVTVLDLSGDGNGKQTFAFDAAPLGVAFGNDGLALVTTTANFLLFNPASGEMTVVDTVPGVVARALPVPAPTYPRAIIRASMTASGDGATIFGTLEPEEAEDKAVVFGYSVPEKRVSVAIWTAEPPLGPRVVSTDLTGSRFVTGWGLFHRAGFLLAQFPDSSGIFDIGSHVVDTGRKRIYAQVAPAVAKEEPKPVCSVVGGVQVCVTPQETTPKQQATPAGPPILQVVDWDNLTVRERLKLPENLTGRSVLSSSGEVMYGTSDSGLMILTIGSMENLARVAARQEDVLFEGSWCDRRTMSQDITIENPGGGRTDFSLTSTLPGVTFSPSSGTTPATVRVSVNPSAFRNERGTVSGLIEIHSNAAVNVPPPVRVLVNNREPDQRGTLLNVPGKLVDLLADPARNRYYVLRQDKNEVLVYDARNNQRIGAMRTGNTPMNMAITLDNKFLITSADNSQVAYVHNLDTLEFDKYIVFPPGHYPRSIAVSKTAILAASRVAGPEHTVDRIDLSGWATTPPTLGIYENKIDMQAVLSATPSGSSILLAEPTGRVMLYDATVDTWVAARQDVKELSGAYAALNDDRFVVGNSLMNKSLVRVREFDSSLGLSSGFAIVDGMGLRTTAPTASSAGVIQRVDLWSDDNPRPTRTSEAPVLATAETGGGFVRTLAPLPNGNGILSLSTSGLTALAWDYDAEVADPLIQKVVSAADLSSGVAPGGLISILGKDLTDGNENMTTNEVPLPTVLGNSCMTVNGVLVPVIFSSQTEIRAQLPVDVSGKGTMVLRTPAGVSNTFTFNIQPNAPAAFQVNERDWGMLPAVYRASDYQLVTPSTPVHFDSWLVIFVTGLGATMPGVSSGMLGPAAPGLAEALVKPEVTLGGVSLPVAFAGLVPGDKPSDVGVYQINVRVPFKEVPTGMEIPLTISQGAYTTTVNVRVVKD